MLAIMLAEERIQGGELPLTTSDDIEQALTGHQGMPRVRVGSREPREFLQPTRSVALK